MTEFDPDKLLADARAKRERANAIANAAYARLGVETAATRPRRSGERFSCRGPLAFLFDGRHPDDVIQDAASFKKVMRVFKKIGPKRAWSRHGCVTTVTLASGKTFRFNFQTGEVTKP